MTHRDLHDGQVLVDRATVDASAVTGSWSATPVGFLDLDTAAVAHPGLDLANLLAHLDLLAGAGPGHQGGQGGQGTGTHGVLVCFQRGLTDALRQHAHPVLGENPAGVEVLRAVTRVRLAAVHAFRPNAPDVVPGLLAPSVLPPWTTHHPAR